jgi:hypothetical protein
MMVNGVAGAAPMLSQCQVVAPPLPATGLNEWWPNCMTARDQSSRRDVGVDPPEVVARHAELHVRARDVELEGVAARGARGEAARGEGRLVARGVGHRELGGGEVRRDERGERGGAVGGHAQVHGAARLALQIGERGVERGDEVVLVGGEPEVDPVAQALALGGHVEAHDGRAGREVGLVPRRDVDDAVVAGVVRRHHVIPAEEHHVVVAADAVQGLDRVVGALAAGAVPGGHGLDLVPAPRVALVADDRPAGRLPGRGRHRDGDVARVREGLHEAVDADDREGRIGAERRGGEGTGRGGRGRRGERGVGAGRGDERGDGEGRGRREGPRAGAAVRHGRRDRGDGRRPNGSAGSAIGRRTPARITRDV